MNGTTSLKKFVSLLCFATLLLGATQASAVQVSDSQVSDATTSTVAAEHLQMTDKSIRLRRPLQISLGLGFGAGKLGFPWIPYPSLRVGYQITEPLNLYAEIEPIWFDNMLSVGAQWTIRPHKTWSPYLLTNVVYGYIVPGDYHRLGASVGAGVNASLRKGFTVHMEFSTTLGQVIGENFYYQNRVRFGFGYRF